MTKYSPSTYGDRIADVYDSLYQQAFDVDGAVSLLAELAGRGPALELGIGTGRVALPLAARGVKVHGLDASKKMVAKLRRKPGGRDIPVTIGDFADVGVSGQHSLVFVVFNTLFGLLTQADQVRCFENVTKRLRKGGVFLVEAFVPDMTRNVRGQSTSTTRVGVDDVWLDMTRFDPVGQLATSVHVNITDRGAPRVIPVRIRYAFPSELDLMARIAGLHLKHRWSGWRKEPFTASSQFHVSVYEKP